MELLSLETTFTTAHCMNFESKLYNTYGQNINMALVKQVEVLCSSLNNIPLYVLLEIITLRKMDYNTES